MCSCVTLQVGSTCEVEVAKCMGRIAANAVSLLNVTVDEEEYDSGKGWSSCTR